MKKDEDISLWQMHFQDIGYSPGSLCLQANIPHSGVITGLKF